MSKSFGFLDAGNDPLKIISRIDDLLVYAARAGVFPEAHPTLFKMASMLGTNSIEHVIEFTTEQVQAYKKNVEGETFLAKALRIQREQPQKLSEKDVLNVCLINVIAGSDTSSVSLTSIMWHLLRNQQALYKVRVQLLWATAILTLLAQKAASGG